MPEREGDVARPPKEGLGREDEQWLGNEDVSEPEETPEDEEDKDEPELCQSINQSINQFNVIYNLT